MPMFKLPLSGDVAQNILPWTNVFAPMGGQWGLVNINLGSSKDPEIEADVLHQVGTYGRQLGRIADAMTVLLDHFEPKTQLKPHEEKALAELRDMIGKINEIKREKRTSRTQGPR